VFAQCRRVRYAADVLRRKHGDGTAVVTLRMSRETPARPLDDDVATKASPSGLRREPFLLAFAGASHVRFAQCGALSALFAIGLWLVK